MSNTLSNNIKKTIKEVSPELYQGVEALKVISKAMHHFAQITKKALQNLANSPEFKKFIEDCKCQIVINKAEEQYWVIDDQVLIKQLQGYSEDNYSEIITNYYTKNKYENIEKLFNNWQGIDCISERIKIFGNCIKTMKVLSDKDLINTVIIPTLLAQTTGITEDLHELVPNETQKQLKNELTNNGKTPSKGEITTEYLWQQERKREVFDCYNVIFNAVMKNTKNTEFFSQEDLEKYNKYRNKILHGDKQFLNYGTDENLVRSWLELNILIKVYSFYKNYETKELENE